MIFMKKVAKGIVVEGRVIVQEGSLPEGARVTIVEDTDEVASDASNDAPYVLSPEEERELLEADAESERGELFDAADVLAELKRLRS